MRFVLLFTTSVLLGNRSEGRAQSAGDTSAIRVAALDHIEGWYTADGRRMERALHPELAKRNVSTDARGCSMLQQLSAMTLVQSTRNGGGSRIPVANRRDEVQILDIYEGAASVKIRAATWIDHLHLSKVNGRWVILNVLWENDPIPATQADRKP